MQINYANQELFYPDFEAQVEQRQERRKTSIEKGYISVSFSALQRAACPFFAVREALNIPGERPPASDLETGKIYHEKIQKYLISGDEAVLEGLTKGTIQGIIKNAPVIKQFGPEMNIERELAFINEKKKFVLHAYTDIDVFNPDAGQLFIIDIKTFSTSTEIRPREHEQLKMYAAIAGAVLGSDIKEIVTYIYRAKKGKLIYHTVYTKKEAVQIFHDELLPRAEAFAEKLMQWISEYRKNNTIDAFAGKHCHLCPHIFSCPLARKTPRNLEEAAARLIVEKEIISTLKDRIGLATIDLGTVLVGPVTHKWENIPNRAISLILKYINELPDQTEREMLISAFAETFSSISKSRVKKAEKVIETILEKYTAYKGIKKEDLHLTKDVLYSEGSRTDRAEIIEKEEEDLDEVL